MKILESSNSKAWMIRNDGKAIPVIQHIYGNAVDDEETMYAAEWLYDNTCHESIKIICIQFIAAYVDKFEYRIQNTRSERLLQIIKDRPYRFISSNFVSKHSKEINEANNTDRISAREQVVNELNQEFLRARFGGMYNTNSNSSEMVFRISSVGFNWYNIIWQFVYERRNSIRNVTIVRDEEATGAVDYVYTNNSGDRYWMMPVKDFIGESGNPVVETNLTMITGGMLKESLKNGMSLVDTRNSIHMNLDRFEDNLARLKWRENHIER